MPYNSGHADERDATLIVPSATDRCMRGREPVLREDGSIEIPLTQGRVALVDQASYPAVRNFLWFAWKHHRFTDTGQHYAATNINGRMTQLSRFLLMAERGTCVDHVNHDPLDNRLFNLRLADIRQNRRNSRKLQGVSRFKGVHPREYDRWCASIRVHGKLLYLGSFGTEDDAARAYDDAARRHFGEFAFTNADAGLL